MAAYSDIDTRKSYVGGISVKVETPNFAIRGRENLREFRRQMRAAHDKGITEGKAIMQSILLKKKIFSSGELINSVASRLFVKTTDVFEGTIHFNNPGKEYAYFVEYGRAGYGPASRPPTAKMIEWGKRKGLSISHIIFIRNKIGEVGTKPKPFMNDAEREINRHYNSIIDKAVERYRNNR